ncbi:MAG TPA: tRNA lysidine(34) synthetase TilS [Clostridiales bacterium]|nr:tRNA lysidine(34) synthetase TilS [Clostridiales bacterium]
MNSSAERLYTAAGETIESFGMLKGADSVLCALSGGSDSVCLLDLMVRICSERGIKLYAAHVNHLIRGDEAFYDARFCSELCESRGILLFSGVFDVPAAAKAAKQPLELAAREIRYRYFESLCRLWGIDRIAVAHNAYDNAETLIFNLCRGASLRGAGGIPPVRGNIIRPLIGCEKSLILDYCAEKSLAYVTDSTNAETIYTRNFIRSEIIPALKRVDPAAVAAISRFSAYARRDDEYLESLAAALPADAQVSELAALADPILTRWLRRRCLEAGAGELESRHIEAAAGFIKSGVGAVDIGGISLPGRIRLDIKRGRAVFSEDIRQKPEISYNIPLREGENPLPQAGASLFISIYYEKYTERIPNIYNNRLKAYLDSDKIKGQLFAAPRRPGEYVRCLGMTKSLSKLMSAADMPPERRASAPVIRDEEGIVCVPELHINGRPLCRDGLFLEKPKNGCLLIAEYISNESPDIT